MGVRGYGLAHIRLAVEVEESGLATPDFLDQKAAKLDKHYLRDEALQERVEMARHFIFDELAMLDVGTFRARLFYHLTHFEGDDRTKADTYSSIVAIVTKSSK